MNANDFVLVPNSKAKSVKLNARNLQDLQKETGTLANRSKEMEEKLQQLKESMNKEKGERRYSEGFKWTSGQCGSQINSSKTNREDKLQKLLAGKVKIRVLKDSTAQLPTAPPQPGPRKSRLQGTICGQCEVKKAGVICKECTENFCIGCFVKFHQKGALKLHTMVPIQADLHTNVSTRDVASHIQKTINPSSDHCDIANPHSSPSMAPSSNRSITPNAITREEDEDPEERREAKDNHMILHCDSSQALVGVHGFKKAEMMIGNNEQTSPSGLLGREYDEEVSASSFQEALRMWRGEKDGRGGENMTAIRTPSRPASVSNMMTQADLHPDTGAQGQRREERGRRVPVRLKFTRNNLTYLDRLCLKKSRRTPIQAYEPSVACSAGVEPPPTATAEEETTSHLTVEEEDFRRYCASLFDVPVTEDRTEPQTTRRCELYLAIDVLDETSTDVKQACDTEQKTESDQEVPSDQVFTRRETPLLPQVPSSSSGPSGVSRSSPGQKQPVRPSQTPVQPKTGQTLLASKRQQPQAARSAEIRLSKSKPSACSTSEASGTSKASIRTPTSKSKANHGSPQFLSSLPHSRPAFPKPCHSALQFSADVLASANNKSAIPKNNLSHSTSTSLSLRSTFTASPLGSTESTLLPKVDHSALLQKHSDSSFLPERPQSSQLPAKPSSSPRQCGSPRDNVVCPPQSRHSLCDHEPLQLDKQFQMSLSPVSAGLDSPPKSLELSLSQQEKEPKRKDGKSSSRLYMFSASPSEEAHVCCSTPTGEEAPAFMSPPSESGGHISPQLHWDAHSILMPSSHLLNVNLSASLAVKMEEEVEQSIDSRDEMSIDSLGLAPDEDSSEEEVLIQEYPRREGTREEQEEPATSHCEDSFVPTESASESEDIFQTDKPELLSETSMVMHNQGAGPGSQHFCDLNGLSPLGLDVKAGDFHTPGRTHCDPLHTCQSSLCDSDQTGSESWGSRGGFQNCTDEHLTSKNTQPTGCKAHSARRQETQLNVQEEFEFDPASRALSRAAREIMEICTVDQAGCEDPDIDTDTTAHMLHGLEHELRLWAEAPEAVVFRMEESANQGQCGNHRVLRGKSGDEEVEEGEKEQEEATAREDQLCVLLLP